MTLDDVLYPPVDRLQQGRLPVSPLHTLHWETCGHPEGIPVLFLHGGPGAGISGTSRRFFDPARYHVVLFDQRGSGLSTPLGETQDNTTAHLIDDIEQLRQRLGIDRWLVFGGSWGSTLALAYAQAHPAACLGLVLRGIWLASQAEIHWWLYGIRNVFPREWEAFANHVPADERDDLMAAYWRRMNDPSPEVALAAARAWQRYEGACLALHPLPAPADEDDRLALGIGRLEAHYFRHGAFLAHDQLLDGMPRMAHLPAAIVHGRYDMICPVRYAHALLDRWPGARLQVVPDAGHSSVEPGIAAGLVAATDAFARDGHFGGWPTPA